MRTRPSRGQFLPLLFGLSALAAPASAVTIEWVFIGDPSNPPDLSDNCTSMLCGSVGYPYAIGRYEVTNAQYAEFLNALAAEDPLGLYNPSMESEASGGITRSGSAGSFTYAVKPGFENKPVNFVSFFDALRFVNWLDNGQGDGDTENGAYTLLAGTPTPSNGDSVAFDRGTFFLPNENEWYEAAYWNPGTRSYLDFPAGSSLGTTCAAPGATPNTANCDFVVGTVTDVGAYGGSASPSGTFDQGGNVAEWNEQISGTFRGRRGGSWNSAASIMNATARGAAGPSSERGAVGFRVARVVPEPAAGGLVVGIVALSGLAVRRRRLRPSL